MEGKISPENLEKVVACMPDTIVFSGAVFEDPEGITAGVKKCREAVDRAAKKYDYSEV